MSLFPNVSVLEVPVGDGEEIVELDLNDDDEIDDRIELLKGEKAQLKLWLQLAIFYYRKGSLTEFQTVLEQAEALMDEVKVVDDHKAMKLRVYTTLAGFYMKKSREASSADKKKEWLAMASKRLTAADRVSMTDEANLVGKGYLYIAQNEMNNAMKMFDYQLTLAGGERHIPSLLGKACVLFNLGKFAESLELYRKVLRIHPGAPAAVRVGIGMCFDRLKQSTKAMLAFERALELDPNCVSAMVGSAVLLLNAGTDLAKQEAASLLRRAYGLSKSNSMVLNHLSDLLFVSQVLPPKSIKAQEEKVLLLALHALKQTDVDEIRAESHYQLARALHFQEKYDEARQHYYQATKLSSTLILAHYGLGQMYIISGERQNAIEMFEKVHKSFPDNYETLRILGSLYGDSEATSKREKAAALLTHVSELKPKDIDNWIELAMLLERTDQRGAIKAYTEASRLLGKHGFQMPPEILNNLGCLHHILADHTSGMKRLQHLTESKTWYEKAFDSLKVTVDDDPSLAETLAGISVTIRYNIARLEEAGNNAVTHPRLLKVKSKGSRTDTLPLEPGTLVETISGEQDKSGLLKVRVRSGPDGEGEIEEDGSRKPKQEGLVDSNTVEVCKNTAKELYESLLSEYSNYTHCHMRLAHIEQTNGNTDKAEEYIKEALSFNERDPEVWTAWGNIYMNKSPPELNAAQKKFEKVLKDSHRNGEPYAALQLGNIWLAAVASAPSNDKKQQYLTRALDSFKSVLKSDDKNLYAAHGIGCVFAQQGRISEAKDIFISVREASPTMPEPWINLAHIYCETKAYDNAIQLYANCLKKHYNGNNVELLQFQARACFKAGKYADCCKVLQKASHIAPNDEVIRFNTGVATLKAAEAILRDNDASFVEVDQAISQLRTARLLFQYLQHTKTKKLDPRTLKKREKNCNDILLQAKNRSEAAKKKRQQKEEERAKVDQSKQAFDKELSEKKKRREEEAVLVEQARLERLKKFEEEVKSTDLLTIEVKRKNSGSRKKKKRTDGEILTDDEEAGPVADDEQGKPPPAKKKKVSKPREKSTKPSKQKKKRKIDRGNISDSDSDSDIQSEQPSISSRKSKKVFKSNEFVDDDDDDDDAEETLDQTNGTEDNATSDPQTDIVDPAEQTTENAESVDADQQAPDSMDTEE